MLYTGLVFKIAYEWLFCSCTMLFMSYIPGTYSVSLHVSYQMQGKVYRHRVCVLWKRVHCVKTEMAWYKAGYIQEGVKSKKDGKSFTKSFLYCSVTQYKRITGHSVVENKDASSKAKGRKKVQVKIRQRLCALAA